MVDIKDTSTIFPLVLSLARNNKKMKVLVCIESAIKISNIPNLEIYVVKDVSDAIEFFNSR